MGTSVSHQSPNAAAWDAVALTYRDADFPIAQVVRQLWRAAQASEIDNWANLLGTAVVPYCLQTAMGQDSAATAIRDATIGIAQARQASIAAEIAKRAMVRSYNAVISARAQAFAAAVFGEASAYLVARDLSGFVGQGMRNVSVQGAREFREAIREHVERIVAATTLPSDPTSPEQWRNYVELTALQLRDTQ